MDEVRRSAPGVDYVARPTALALHGVAYPVQRSTESRVDSLREQDRDVDVAVRPRRASRVAAKEIRDEQARLVRESLSHTRRNVVRRPQFGHFVSDSNRMPRERRVKWWAILDSNQ